MKRMMQKFVPGLLLLGFLGLSAHAQVRVATVDLQKVFDKYWRTERMTAGLKDRVADLEKTHKEMLEDWKKAKEDYDKLLQDANNQAVSSQERDRRKKAAEEKLKDIKVAEDNITQFERQAAVTINEQKSRMRKNLLEEIKRTVESKAKAGGYALVLDSGAQTYAADPSGPFYTPTILYSSDTIDLTDAVISQLNAGAPLDLPQSEPEQKPQGSK
jgi:outer membrane protein